MAEERPPARPLVPVLPWGPPTDVLELAAGPGWFESTGQAGAITAPTSVQLLLRAGSHLQWTADLSGLPVEAGVDWQREVGRSRSGRLHFELSGVPVAVGAHSLAVGRGYLAGRAEHLGPDRIDRLVSHWVNLPAVGADTLLSNSTDGAVWLGRRVFDLGHWQVVLDSRPDLEAVYREASRSYRSVLTHTMQIRRIDGSEFCGDAAERILGELHLAFSFPLGRWAAPVLSVGFSQDSVPVFSLWYAWHVDTPGRDASGWRPKYRPEFLLDYLPAILREFGRPDEFEHLEFLITSSLAAGEGGFAEQRLATGLAAIEYLSWVDEVLGHRLTEEEWFHGLDVAKRIRRLLRRANIRLPVDRTRCPSLAAFAKPDKDGPAALAAVRDMVTHPKSRDVLDGEKTPLFDAARLCGRYLDLLILHRIGYAGVTRDRTKLTGSDWECDQVPWTV